MAYRPPLLIANRGEIAIRIARTARALGFPTIAVYSEADRNSEHVRACDQAYFIGAPEPKSSYLDVSKLIEVAQKSGAKLVHPGYGFLSERAHFVKACEAAGITFVGPSANSMEIMGDKITARRTVDALGVPRIPGSAGALTNAQEAKELARKIGYPVLLKATAGGGGKGMRRVDTEAEVQSAFEGASREALGAFGDGSMYLEKYIVEPHHVEVQVFGDGKGKAVHLGERECSIQRRHQKVWEESPSPILMQHPETRPKMFEAAVRIAEHIKYAGAGTFEFIVDGKGNFYFLEMNTRLQVEHPVTEWVTGVDLVKWQLLLAVGELGELKTPEFSGCAIEARVYAEDPQTFLPAPGKLGLVRSPNGPSLRWDSAFDRDGEVSMYYDPMISKLSAWGRDRAEAISRIRVALDELRIEPARDSRGFVSSSLKTNLGFLRRLSRNKDVLEGNTTTALIEHNPELVKDLSADLSPEAALALALFQQNFESGIAPESNLKESESEWSRSARWEGAKSWR